MNSTYIFAGISMLLIGAMARYFYWHWSGGAYYARYPGAKLIDDLAREGSLGPGDVEAIVARVGAARDLNAEVQSIRIEKSL
ncbi:hypothetical protein [Ralstonia sp. ASV6]|uniref:hypothetical protein n=1 Tax=Ralstonia sp. ASV6 TaxID=2795124 RepID=UPI0018EB29C8|nr:hypothetical protein [Ralstonia sp. ASV6]